MESAEQHEFLNSLWEANWLYLSTPARDKDFVRVHRFFEFS